MSLISIPNTFSAGAVIIASQHNANFNAIFNDYNGFIDNTNIASGAAIAYSKLNLALGIVNADINASAAIVDTKLAQITTASKVSGAAITLLTSLPAGAGVIPIANLASGTPTGSKYVRDDGTLQTVSIPVASNVLFSYSGQTDSIGYNIAASLNTAASVNYAYWAVANAGSSSYRTIISCKWTKMTGVSTVTVYCNIWSISGAGAIAQCNVNIGSASGSVSGTTGQTTPEWKNFTVDVSGLSVGVNYDVTIQIARSDASSNSVYLGSIIAYVS